MGLRAEARHPRAESGCLLARPGRLSREPRRFTVAPVIALLLAVFALGSPLTAQVSGTVVDALTGRGIEGARVVVIDGDRRALAASTSTVAGVFRIDVEPTPEVRLVVTMAGYRASAPLALPARGDGTAAAGDSTAAVVAARTLRIELTRLAPGEGYLPDLREEREGRILGRVSDPDGIALKGVLVSAADDQTLTNDKGFFEVRISETGAIPVTFEMLGRATIVDTVQTQAEEGLFLRVAMPVEALELEPLTVTAVSRRRLAYLETITRRVAMGFGSFITAGELRDRGYPSLDAVLRAYPRMRPTSLSGCSIIYYQDGMKVSSLAGIHGMDIELIEVYRGPASTPPEYIDSDSQCGVIAVWTKRGVDLPLDEILDWRLGG